MIDEKTQNELKARLEQESATLELELTDIGHLNPANPNDWQGDKGNYETGTADSAVLADRFEEITTNEAVVNELEGRFNAVKAALKRMEDGTYGTCTSTDCDGEIPVERLEANPAASTCLSHAA